MEQRYEQFADFRHAMQYIVIPFEDDHKFRSFDSDLIQNWERNKQTISVEKLLTTLQRSFYKHFTNVFEENVKSRSNTDDG